LLPPLLSSSFLHRSALNTDNNRRFYVKLNLCGYSAISIFPLSPQWGETTHQTISFSLLQRQDIYVKLTVLGALKNIYTTMYKECQKENCYQVFPFLHIFLLFFFLILSMCSVMYDFIFLAFSWLQSIPKRDFTWFETFSVSASQKNYVINVSIISEVQRAWKNLFHESSIIISVKSDSKGKI